MEIETLVRYLDDADAAGQWLKTLGLHNLARGHRNLMALADAGLTLDLVAEVCVQLADLLPEISDPDMALNNLERFVSASRNPLSVGSLIERDKQVLPILLQILSTSQHFSDVLIRDPESFDLLRMTDGRPVNREILVEEICNEVESAVDERQVMTILRRYKRRETLRIAFGDIVRKQHVEVVTRQISHLADAICEAALRWSRRTVAEKRGEPRRADGQPARFVALALGKLGGAELNYSSDIDLIFLCDPGGATDGRRSISNGEFFERLVRQFVKLLAEQTPLGVAYRVDLRLRPDGRQGPPVLSTDAALQYYDVSGRTWERQAYVKARPIAGDLELGREFLGQLERWVYRRYLSRADITGIKALKRRIEQRAAGEENESDKRNVKTGHGGIRDIEFVIQFLQLLNGGDLPAIRTGNTLEAIAKLEQAGCLTMQERSILEENYALLRKIEHRLQIMFDLQTHTLPDDPVELGRLAIRLGFAKSVDASALQAFQQKLDGTTQLNRKILDHLLHDAFGDKTSAEPETDLVLHPDPAPEDIERCLSKHGFSDPSAAYQNLMALATEKVSFLSTRRCRHFLAAIAPGLLKAISKTPDPDSTLVNLSMVSDSLGGKGVLWELFSFNPPTMKLYVQLCASSPYLSGILTSNPGMIDELMDSLMIGTLPSLETLDETLQELCRGAEDTDVILHSFKDSQHLRVGVRDILGKQDIRDTHRTLSDTAEVCLKRIALREFEQLAEKFGQPTIGEGPLSGQPCELIILAMGKLGGREPNYHSDLDVVFLYEADGSTRPTGRRSESTSNQHFFSQLGQRIIKAVTYMGPYGRLYELDPRLRPTGKSGSLSVSLPELERYFREGRGQLWERQALCKARTVFGSVGGRAAAMEVVRRIILDHEWTNDDAEEIRKMRMRLEETASKRNLKRGRGGTVDIEFIVQMLQLRHAREKQSVLTPGTLDAIAALQHHGYLNDEDAKVLTNSYRFLRSVESGLRLMNTTARHDIPDDDAQLTKLSFLLGYDGPETIRRLCEECTAENRRLFERIFDATVTA